MRGVAGETLLPLEGLVEPLQKAIERARQAVQLVAGPRAGEALDPIGGAHGTGDLGHPGHRERRSPAEATAHERGQQPDDGGEPDQGHRHATEGSLHRLRQCAGRQDQGRRVIGRYFFALARTGRGVVMMPRLLLTSPSGPDAPHD